MGRQFSTEANESAHEAPEVDLADLRPSKQAEEEAGKPVPDETFKGYTERHKDD